MITEVNTDDGKYFLSCDLPDSSYNDQLAIALKYRFHRNAYNSHGNLFYS